MKLSDVEEAAARYDTDVINHRKVRLQDAARYDTDVINHRKVRLQDVVNNRFKTVPM